MKTFFFTLIFFLISSTSFGQFNNYQSISHCVVEVMKELDLTGNRMFDLIQEDCERMKKIFLEMNKPRKGILYYQGMCFFSGDNILDITEWSSGSQNSTRCHYVGDIEMGIPNGQGIFKNSYDFSFKGNWKNGLPHGKGEVSWNFNGGIFIIKGEWKDGKPWNVTDLYTGGNPHIGKDPLKQYRWIDGVKCVYKENYEFEKIKSEDHTPTCEELTPEDPLEFFDLSKEQKNQEELDRNALERLTQKINELSKKE